MSSGILYNIFTCFVSGFTGLLVFYLLHKRRRKEKVGYHQGIDYFSLFFGLVWVLVGIRNIFAWLGKPEINILISRWMGEPLIYLHLLPAFYYFGWSFFKEKKKARLLFNGFFSLVVFLAVLSYIKYGLIPGEVTPWGMKNESNPITKRIFVYGILLPAALVILIELGRRFKKWRETKSPYQKQLFGFSVGFLIYLLTGALETLAFKQSWLMVLVRIIIMTAPLTFYVSATGNSNNSDS